MRNKQLGPGQKKTQRTHRRCMFLCVCRQGRLISPTVACSRPSFFAQGTENGSSNSSSFLRGEVTWPQVPFQVSMGKTSVVSDMIDMIQVFFLSCYGMMYNTFMVHRTQLRISEHGGLYLEILIWFWPPDSLPIRLQHSHHPAP